MTEPSKVIEFSPKLFKRLQRENAELKKKINDIVAQIRINERVQIDFNRIEGKILESRTIEEMVSTLVSEIRRRFKLECVSLSLALNPRDILARKKAREGARSTRNLLNISTGKLRKAFPKPPTPILRSHFDKDLEIFFPHEARPKVASCAILPLLVRGKWIGSLSMGSAKAGHYGPHQATDLLESLSQRIAVLVDYLLLHQRFQNLSRSESHTDSSGQKPIQSAIKAEGEGSRRGLVQKKGMEIVVAAGAVICRGDGKVLLVKQVPEIDNYWKGKWICPGGRVEPGEKIEEAVLREVEEETHLQIKLIKPILPFERIVKRKKEVLLHVIYFDYLAKMVGGKLKPDDDVVEALWLDAGEIRGRLEELHVDTQKLLRLAEIL